MLSMLAHNMEVISTDEIKANNMVGENLV